MKTITMHDLHDHFKKLGKEELILDIRRPDEFAEGHIPGARNIPHDQVEAHLNELKKYKKIYVHCRSGGRVGLVLPALTKIGEEKLACVLKGGFPEWEEAGFERE